MLKPVFTTIEQGLVICTMGQIKAADAKTLREVIGDVIGCAAGLGLTQDSKLDPTAAFVFETEVIGER